MSTMNGEQRAVGVLPVGMGVDLVVRIIASNVNAHLGLATEIDPPRALPPAALDRTRGQCNAGTLMRLLEETVPDGHGKVLAVCSDDLFVPIVTHVYGEAQQGGRVAVVSLFRLGQPPSNEDPANPFFERAVKIALHEVGHLFNLTHCRDPGCLMHFSSTLDELDATPVFLCRYCHRYFQSAAQP